MSIIFRTALVTIQLFVLFTLCIFGQQLRMPAEWEPHERVWLTWFGAERRDAVSCEIVKALLPNVKLTINVESEAMKINAVK